MKKYYIAFLFISVSMISPVSSFAQSTASTSTHISIFHNLSYGKNNSHVVALQQLLQSFGFFPKNIIPTGYFGSVTLLAVKNYQKANGISATGFVGSLTRASLATHDTVTILPQPIQCNPRVECAAPPQGCSYINTTTCGCGTLSCSMPVRVITTIISAITPTSGPFGTLVTIIGSKFTITGNTVNFGSSTVISNLSSPDGTTLTFTVPSMTHFACEDANTGTRCLPPDSLIQPGTYNVSVSNSTDTSNIITFKVTK